MKNRPLQACKAPGPHPIQLFRLLFIFKSSWIPLCQPSCNSMARIMVAVPVTASPPAYTQASMFNVFFSATMHYAYWSQVRSCSDQRIGDVPRAWLITVSTSSRYRSLNSLPGFSCRTCIRFGPKFHSDDSHALPIHCRPQGFSDSPKIEDNPLQA